MASKPWQLWRSNPKYITDQKGFVASLQTVKNTWTNLQERNGELQDWESSCLSRSISNVGS
jgi:hypothetical protein